MHAYRCPHHQERISAVMGSGFRVLGLWLGFRIFAVRILGLRLRF